MNPSESEPNKEGASMSMTFTPEEQAANRAAWVCDLRSGEYQQANGSLVETTTSEGGAVEKLGHCCLGVACETAIKAGVVWIRWSDESQCFQYMGSQYDDMDEPIDGTTVWTDEEEGSLPPPMVAWLGLTSKEGELTTAGSNHYEGAAHLIYLNDDAHLDFDQIATAIEVGKVRVQGGPA